MNNKLAKSERDRIGCYSQFIEHHTSILYILNKKDSPVRSVFFGSSSNVSKIKLFDGGFERD